MRLRHFACLSKGDIVAINYNNKVGCSNHILMPYSSFFCLNLKISKLPPKIYELNVMETKPAAAVSIIECDMNVDFEVLGKEKSSSELLLQSLLFQAPPGYEEPRVQKPQPMEEEEPELDVSQVVFCQSGGYNHVFLLSRRCCRRSRAS